MVSVNATRHFQKIVDQCTNHWWEHFSLRWRVISDAQQAHTLAEISASVLLTCDDSVLAGAASKADIDAADVDSPDATAAAASNAAADASSDAASAMRVRDPTTSAGASVVILACNNSCACATSASTPHQIEARNWHSVTLLLTAQ